MKNNKARCKKCGDIIESKHQHDFVRCSCGEIFIDGGTVCPRGGANNWKNFEDLSITEINEMEKYELTNEAVEWWGRTLYRIKALKDFSGVKVGELGGFIEKEENLSQEGNAWVYSNAKVYDDARVYGDAMVSEGAWVSACYVIAGVVGIIDGRRRGFAG